MKLKYGYGVVGVIVLCTLAYLFVFPSGEQGQQQEQEGQETTAARPSQRAAQRAVSSDEDEAARSSQRSKAPAQQAKANAGQEGKAQDSGQEAQPQPLPTLVSPAGGPRSLQQHLDKLGLKLEDIPVQSPARPFGMDIIAPALDSADDKRRASFVTEALPEINAFLEESFKDRPNIDANSENLTLEDLKLEETANVRVYFIKEGTVFHNTLGIAQENEDKIIFPDTSSRRSYYRDAETREDFTSPEVPLMPGDYVDLGVMQKGELLDFFLIKDGARIEPANEQENQQGDQATNQASGQQGNQPAKEEGKPNIYWVDPESNADQVNHVKYHGMYNENTMIIGFEDLPGGGDRDYNDLVIAVELTAP